jgi:hypothetical protein
MSQRPSTRRYPTRQFIFGTLGAAGVVTLLYFLWRFFFLPLDKPIIMTGGSFVFYAGAALTTTPHSRSDKVWKYELGNYTLKKIKVRWPGGKFDLDDADRIVFTFDNPGQQVSVASDALLITASGDDDPLKRDTETDVDDLEGKKIKLFRHHWESSRIKSVQLYRQRKMWEIGTNESDPELLPKIKIMAK